MARAEKGPAVIVVPAVTTGNVLGRLEGAWTFGRKAR